MKLLGFKDNFFISKSIDQEITLAANLTTTVTFTLGHPEADSEGTQVISLLTFEDNTKWILVVKGGGVLSLQDICVCVLKRRLKGQQVASIPPHLTCLFSPAEWKQ